jgi:hypothetical protein
MDPNEKFSNLCAYLDRLEATSGKLDKMSILTDLAADDLVADMAKAYLSVAQDWYRIYNVGEKSLEEPKKKGKGKGKAEQANFDADTPFAGEPQPAPKAEPKPQIGVDPWDAFLSLIALCETPGKRPSKEEVRERVNAFTDPQIKKWVTRALLKDLRMGVSEKTVNKVWPGLIRYFEVQLADSLEDLTHLELPEDDTQGRNGYLWLEPKLDGVRAICRVDGKKKTVKFLSRGGQALYNTDAAGIDARLLQCITGDVVFDGELFCENFNNTMKVVRHPDDPDPELVKNLRFFVFDMISGEDWDRQKCDLTLNARRTRSPSRACHARVTATTAYW